MDSEKLTTFFKRLTVLFFVLSIVWPVLSLYRLPLRESGHNYLEATYRLITSIPDRGKMDAIMNKSRLRRDVIGMRNYLLYSLYERQIKDFTLHDNRWMDYADAYRFQRQHNAVPLRHVEKLAGFFQARKIPWIVLGIPKKSYIYPEKAGLHIVRNSSGKTRFLEAIQKNTAIHYIDAYETFLKSKDKYLLFNGVEHHSNNIGNFLAFSLLTRAMNSIFKDKAPVLDENSIAAVDYKKIDSRHSYDEFGEVPSDFLSVLRIRDYGIEYPYGYVTLRGSFLDKEVEIYNFRTEDRLFATSSLKKFDRNLFGKRHILSLTRCPAALTPLKVLAVGNSHKPGMAIYYTRYFKLTVSKFYARNGFEFDYDEEVALYEDFVKRFGVPDAVLGIY